MPRCCRRMRNAILVSVQLLIVSQWASTRGAELKVMSFNILHGGTALGQPLSKTAEVIAASGADLIGIQEQSGSTASLANLLGFHYYVQDNDISFLSRFPITRSLSSGVEVELPFGQSAYLFNVHLAAYPYQPYDIRDGLIESEADAIAHAETARGAAMSQTLQTMLPYVEAGDPVFLVGDFNEPSHLDWTMAAAEAGQNFGMRVAWPASRKAVQGGLTDTFRAIFPDPVERRGDTWTPLDAPGEVHDRIDIVYHAGDTVEPLDFGIVGEHAAFADLVVTPYPSDHRAVVGRYALSAVGGLTVRVDRGRGFVVVQNTSSEAISFDGYSMTSSGGHLVTGDEGWQSLADHGFGGWQEANPTASRLSELNPLATMTLAPNEAVGLGRAYGFQPAALGQPYPQDVRFRYYDPSGETLSAMVEFHGWRNNLVLLINPATGEAVLENQSPFDLAIDGYRISSASGSLRPDDGAWISLSDRAMDTWVEANPSTKMLAELNPIEADVIGAGARIRLGSLLDPRADLDLAFEFLMEDESSMREGWVIYESFSSGCPEGDANGDCRVDLADLNSVRNLFGMSGIGLAGDVDFDGHVDLVDLNMVRNRFGETGSFAASEAPTWLMLAVGLCGLVSQRSVERRCVCQRFSIGAPGGDSHRHTAKLE